MADPHLLRVLEDLVETLEDSKRGFNEAADQLGEDGYYEIADELRQLSAQRARFATELRDKGLELGATFDERGSLAGLLHRRWLALRDTFGTDEAEAVLEEAITGERQARQQFDRVLTESELPDDIRDLLVRQVDEMAAATDHLTELQESSLG